MAGRSGIDWVPIFSIPIERRLQTISVLIFVCLFLVAPIFFSSLFIYLLFSRWYWIALLYFTWITYDFTVRKISSRGGRRLMSVRRWKLWCHMRDYFPISLLKTADLDPKKNYIMGYHPHGIMGCGAFCNFLSEATDFQGKFPGITPHLLTLKTNFIWPLLRGLILYLGGCDVSKESILWITSKQGVGNAAIIVIGGADEALEAKPESFILTLKRRKGFCKLALRTGASLVPIFSFGENDLYTQADNRQGTLLRKFQTVFKNIFGFSPPLFHGRGVFNYTFGMIPYRTPIHTVVGRPIDVEKTEQPTQEQIDDLHQNYINELSNLFEEHKSKYGVDEKKKLIFV